MKKIGLSVYALYVKDKDKGEQTNANLLIDDKSFIDLVYDFYEDNKDFFHDDQTSENVFKFIKVKKETIQREERDSYTYITGQVNTGEYGYEADLVDHTTGEISKTKTYDEAEVMPFSFYIGFPAGECNMGIAIFQTEGRYSMKTIFQRRLKKFIRSKDGNIDFSFSSIAPKQYLEDVLIKGHLKQLRLIKYCLNAETTEQLGVNHGVEVKEERIFHRPEGFMEKHLPFIREWLDGKRSRNQLVAVNDFDYDQLKLVMEVGGREKTFDLANLESLVITIDITEEAGREREHPVAEVVWNQMISVGEDYLERIGIVR